jgi:hypothetical protein
MRHWSVLAVSVLVVVWGFAALAPPADASPGWSCCNFGSDCWWPFVCCDYHDLHAAVCDPEMVNGDGFNYCRWSCS